MMFLLTHSSPRVVNAVRYCKLIRVELKREQAIKLYKLNFAYVLTHPYKSTIQKNESIERILRDILIYTLYERIHCE